MLKVYKPTARSKFCIIEVDQYGNRKRYVAESIFNQNDADDLVSAYNRAEAEKIRADAAEARADDLAAIAAQLEVERDELRRQLEQAKENERNAHEKLDWLISHDPEE